MNLNKTLDRRNFILGLGAAAGAAVLAGCGGNSGAGAAASTDSANAASYALAQSFSDLQIVKEIPTGEQYGIAVSKDNPELTQAVNKALEDMKSDGTMKEIETKWFGSEI